jgi:hypothetical protein
MGVCRDLKGSAVRSVVLGIRLTAATIANRDEIANKVLADPEVRKALHDAFRKEAGLLTENSLAGKALDGAAAKRFLLPIRGAAGPAAVTEVKKQPEFHEARQGLQKLKCAFDATPVGIFVNDNKTWLIIVGIVMGAGGAAAMYRARSGDVPAKGMTMLTNMLAEKIEVGEVTFSLKGVEFKPSARDVKGKIGVEMGDLKSVKLKQNLEIAAVVKAGSLQELMLSDTLVVPLADATKLSAKAAVGMKDSQPAYEMALTVKQAPNKGLVLDVTAYYKGLGPSQTLGAAASAGYRINTSRILGPQSHTTLGATGKVEATRPGAALPFETSGSMTVGLTATFL